MILDVKKNIFFGILLSLITFLFMFTPGVKAEEDFTNGHVSLNLINVDESSSYYNNFQKALDYYNKNCSGQEFIISNALGNGYGDNQVAIACFNKGDLDIYLNYYDTSITSNVKSLEVYRKNNSNSDIKINMWWNTSNTGNWEKINKGNSYSNLTYLKDTGLVWYSSLPLKYSTDKSNNRFSLDKYYDKIYINDKEYSNGDIVINANESILNDVNKSYTFNEDIDVTNISKVKVKFKLPSNTSNLAINLKYKISQLGFGVGTLGDPYVSLRSIENNIDKTSINSLKSYRNRDHLIEEMKNCVSNYYDSIGATHDGSKNVDTLISKLDSISRYDDHKNLEIESAIKSVFVENDELFVTLYPLALRYVDQDYCSGTYVVSLLPDSTVYEYTFEVDVYNYEGSINLNFTSSLNYEIVYEYKNDLDNYLTIINMKEYSALILIPKVKNLDSGSLTSIQSDIYLSGTYDIELWEDVENKNVLYRNSNYSYNVFSHYHNYNYLSATLFFIKKPVEDSKKEQYITFDNRYYSYVTKTTLSDEVIINNPNTGEDITIGDISNLYDSNLNSSGFSILDYLDSIKNVSDYFNYNFKLNWDKLPFSIRSLILFVFNMACILVILKIGGYK